MGVKKASELGQLQFIAEQNEQMIKLLQELVAALQEQTALLASR